MSKITKTVGGGSGLQVPPLVIDLEWEYTGPPYPGLKVLAYLTDKNATIRSTPENASGIIFSPPVAVPETGSLAPVSRKAQLTISLDLVRGPVQYGVFIAFTNGSTILADKGFPDVLNAVPLVANFGKISF